jgi:hypothetical protein
MEVSERVKVLRDHFVTVKQEPEQIQTLVEQKTHEIETEDHLKPVERETGWSSTNSVPRTTQVESER